MALIDVRLYFFFQLQPKFYTHFRFYYFVVYTHTCSIFVILYFFTISIFTQIRIIIHNATERLSVLRRSSLIYSALFSYFPAAKTHSVGRNNSAYVLRIPLDMTIPMIISGCVAQWTERRSLAGELTLSCTRPAADG